MNGGYTKLALSQQIITCFNFSLINLCLLSPWLRTTAAKLTGAIASLLKVKVTLTQLPSARHLAVGGA